MFLALMYIFLIIGIIFIGISLWYFFSKKVKDAFFDVKSQKHQEKDYLKSKKEETPPKSKKESFIEEEIEEAEVEIADKDDANLKELKRNSPKNKETEYLKESSEEDYVNETEYLESELKEAVPLDNENSHDETEYLDEGSAHDETEYLKKENTHDETEYLDKENAPDETEYLDSPSNKTEHLRINSRHKEPDEANHLEETEYLKGENKTEYLTSKINPQKTSRKGVPNEK